MRVGIDIGGSHIAVATVDDNGKIIQKIEQDLEEHEKMEKYILNYVDKCIEKLCKNVNIKQIGIVAPGKPEGTIIRNLVNLGIEKIDFKSIEEKYKMNIKYINDAKAAALAEKEYGALKGYKDSAFLCLGTGIGGAIFLNNELLISNRNPGFEIGHMIIEREGEQCNCGKKGCFETYCSMKRFKNKVEIILERLYPSIKIENSNQIRQFLEENIENKDLQTIIDEYIGNLIIGLSNVIDIFEPEIICLGGSFAYFKNILYDKLVTNMKEKKYVFNKESVPKIVVAKLQNDAGIIGATLI